MQDFSEVILTEIYVGIPNALRASYNPWLNKEVSFVIGNLRDAEADLRGC